MKKNDWALDLFAAIDRGDADGFASYLTDDVVFCFGNLRATHGRAAVRDVVADFFRSISALRHELQNSWHSSGHVICRGRVTYTRHDASTLTVPFATVFKMHGEKIREYDIYVDISRLYDQ